MLISRSFIYFAIVLVGLTNSVRHSVDFTPHQALKQCLDSIIETEESCLERLGENTLKRSSFSKVFYTSAKICLFSLQMINEEYITGYSLEIIHEAMKAALVAKSEFGIKINKSLETEEEIKKNRENFQKRRVQIENQLKKIIESKNVSKTIEEKIVSLETEKMKIDKERAEFERKLALEEAQISAEEETRLEEQEEIELDRGNKEKWHKIWAQKLKEENQIADKIRRLEGATNNHKELQEQKEMFQVVIFEKMRAFKLYMGLPFDNRIKPPNFKAKKTTPSELDQFKREAMTEIGIEEDEANKLHNHQQQKEQILEKKVKEEIKVISHLEEEVKKPASQNIEKKTNKISQELEELHDLKKQIVTGAKLQESEVDDERSQTREYQTKTIFITAEEFEKEKREFLAFMFTISSIIKDLERKESIAKQKEMMEKKQVVPPKKESKMFSMIKKKLSKRI